MNILRRIPGVPRTHSRLRDDEQNLDHQLWADEDYQKLRNANARLPKLDEEIMRLKKEKKVWIAQKTNLEQDHQMFQMENKNLRASAETSERRWVEAKKHSERLESDNAELRKRLLEEEIKVKELKEKFGCDKPPLSSASSSTHLPITLSTNSASSNSFMKRVMLTKERLTMNMNEKLGGRSRIPEKVVSLAVFNERTGSLHQENLSLSEEVQGLKKRLAESEHELKTSNDKNAGIKQTNRNMEQQVMDLRSKLKTLSASLRGRSGELECVREEKDRQTKDFERVKQELESALAGISLVREEVSQEKNRNKACAEELDRLFMTNKSLENEIENLRSSTRSAKAELEKARNIIIGLNSEVTSTRQRLADTQTKEKKSSSIAKSLNKQLELTHSDLQTMREQNKALYLQDGERTRLTEEVERLRGVEAELLKKLEEAERVSEESARRYEGELIEALECSQINTDQISEELRLSEEQKRKTESENVRLKTDLMVLQKEVKRLKQGIFDVESSSYLSQSLNERGYPPVSENNVPTTAKDRRKYPTDNYTDDFKVVDRIRGHSVTEVSDIKQGDETLLKVSKQGHLDNINDYNRELDILHHAAHSSKQTDKTIISALV